MKTTFSRTLFPAVIVFLVALLQLFKTFQTNHSAVGKERLPVRDHNDRLLSFIKVKEKTGFAVSGQQGIKSGTDAGDSLIK